MESTEAPPPPTAPPRDAPSKIERLLARAVPLAEAVARRKGASAAAAGEIAQNVLIDIWQFVGRVLADVPEASREVFLLVYRDHATYDEVAQARGIAPATARVHCHNVLRSLRASLGHLRTLLT